MFDRERPDLVILDLGLPDMDGSEVCRKVRDRADTPILILSARGEEKHKIAALDQGADDYVTKPFGPEEFMARVRAALRRSLGQESTLHGHLTRGDLTIDFDRRRVHRGELEIRLSPKEFDLFTLLVTHAGRVLTHRSILKAIWGSRPRATGTPSRTDGSASEENRTGSCESAVPVDRTLGWLSLRGRT